MLAAHAPFVPPACQCCRSTAAPGDGAAARNLPVSWQPLMSVLPLLMRLLPLLMPLPPLLPLRRCARRPGCCSRTTSARTLAALPRTFAPSSRCGRVSAASAVQLPVRCCVLCFVLCCLLGPCAAAHVPTPALLCVTALTPQAALLLVLGHPLLLPGSSLASCHTTKTCPAAGDVQAALLPVLGHASRPLRHTAGTCAVTIVNQAGLGAWPELVAALAEGLDAAGDANRLEGALDLVYKVGCSFACSLLLSAGVPGVAFGL